MLLLSYFLLPCSMGALSLLLLWEMFDTPQFQLFLGLGWMFAGAMTVGYLPVCIISFLVSMAFIMMACRQAVKRGVNDVL